METLSLAAAIVVAVVCGGLSLLHLSWAAGSRWPGTDDADLFDLVVGAPLSPRASAAGAGVPGVAACVVVAVLLAGAGAVVVASVDVLAVCVGVVFFARGVGGFFDARLRPATVGTRFERLNRVFYSPLCLALAALVAVAVVGR